MQYPPAETKIPLKALLQSTATVTVTGNGNEAEQSICRATGSTYCCFGPSGRGLLFYLIKKLSQLDDGRRNEVLIPGYTCYSVPAAIVKAGLNIRYYDLDPATLNPVPGSLQSNCSARTIAIVSQHLFGIPMDLDLIETMAGRQNVCHIEDAAQAFGGRHKGRALGTTGDFGLFSFGRGKSLPLGSGGALISRRHNLAEILPPMRSRNTWRPFMVNLITQLAARPSLYGIAEMLPLGLGETIFDPDFTPGTVSRIQKKLLTPMMAYHATLNRHRRAVASIYRSRIHTKALIAEPEGAEPIYARFPVIAKSGHLPTQLWQLGVRRLYPNALNREAGINAHAANPNERLPGANRLAENLVTLPTHHSIDDRIAVAIARKLNRWIDPPLSRNG